MSRAPHAMAVGARPDAHLVAEALHAVSKGAVQNEQAVRARQADQVDGVAVPGRTLEHRGAPACRCQLLCRLHAQPGCPVPETGA